MPALSPASRSLQARIARATHDRRVTPAALAALRRDFAASMIESHLDFELAAAPALTRDQLDALHAVIRRHAIRTAP